MYTCNNATNLVLLALRIQLLFPHGFEFISSVPWQLALFLLEQNPLLKNHPATLLDFPRIMTACLLEPQGYVILNNT